MKVQISYDEVKRRFPDEVDLIMAKLRKSSSKEKHRDEEDLRWEFSWGQQIQMYTFDQVFKGKPERAKTFPELFEEATRENVLFFLGESIIWGINGRVGRWSGSGTPQMQKLHPLPNEILDLYVDMYNKQIIEQKRIASLSPKERDQEVQECLRQLRGSSGFVELRIGGKTEE